MAYPVVASLSGLAHGSGGAGIVTATKPTGLTLGDLMIAHLVSRFTTTAPAGWTQLAENDNGSDRFVYVFGKIADSADVAATGFDFNNGDTGSVGYLNVEIARITGGNGSLPTFIHSSNFSTASATDTGITPTGLQGTLFITVADMNTTAIRTSSAYAVVNSNPTWTEQYDTGATDSGAFKPHIAMATGNWGATSGTATGTVSATLNSTSAGTINVFFVQPGSTVVATPISFSAFINASTFVRMLVATPLVLTMTLGNAIVSEVLNKWSNLSKTVSTWINQNKP